MWSRVRSPVRAMVRRSLMEREVDMELRFHMEAFAEGLGAPRRASRRSTAAGTHRVGGMERAKEECP
jgi:hypothetical protein